MKELTVCFIGIGSIAKRHINNLCKFSKENGALISIDAVRRNVKSDEDSLEGVIRNIYYSISELNTIYDVIFITNPTEHHVDSLIKATKYAKHFFIEKPITSLAQIERIKTYSKKKDAVYYVACPLRYNAVIQYIKNHVQLSDVISIRCISSSYLPEWRPGQDYRNTYSAQKALGGGVSIDLIHEWDYITYLFGMPEKVNCMFGRKSDLEIDSEDYAIYIAEYKKLIVELHLDYFGRKTIREITLFTKHETIIGDIANNKISYLRSGKTIEFDENRDDYQLRELKHFFDIIDGKENQDSTIEHAVKVLELARGIV